MSVELADKLSVRVVFRDKKYSSGFIYHTETHTYIFTAKHAICDSEKIDCKNKKCDVCTLKSPPKTKIIIDKPDVTGFGKKRIKKILQSSSKDIAILVLNDKDHNELSGLPPVKVYPINEVQENDKLISCGYPEASSHSDVQPIIYSMASPFRDKLCLHISSDTTSNLEPSKENLAGNSGCGVIKQDNKTAKLIGIYTDTNNMAICYAEIIDSSINDILIKNNLPRLEIENVNKLFKTNIKSDFTKCFKKIEHSIKTPENREINLYRLSLNGKDYDYEKIMTKLVECVPPFTLTRKQLKKSREDNEYANSVLSSVRRFLKLESENKVFELLLQGFLEAYLDAPRLYSSHQSNNCFQGAHINFNERNSLEIIHCLAEISPSLEHSFKAAIEAIIRNFPRIRPFSNLIDNGLLDNHFSDDEYRDLKKILLPTTDSDAMNYNDRLAIFIGYDRKIESELLYMQQNDFINELEERIINDVRNSIELLDEEFDRLGIIKATIDCFFVPFESVESFSHNFIESLG